MNLRRFAMVVPPEFPFPHPPPGGEDYFMEPSRMMMDEGFRVEILTLRLPYQTMCEIVDSIPIRRFNTAAGLIGHIATVRYELIHGHSDFRPALLAGLLALCSKTILTRHSYILPANSIKRRALVALLNRFDRVIALSPYEKEVYVRQGMDTTKVSVTYNGINVGFFQEGGDGRRFRSRWSIPLGAPMLLTVANLRTVKNPHTLLQALALVRKSRPEARLVVLGKDLLPREGKPALAVIARELGVEHATICTDWQPAEALRDAMTAADVVLNSSFNEGLALAVCEAAAASKPLCLPDIGSFRSVFGSHALYHSPTDHETLAANVMRYLDDTELRNRHVIGSKAVVSQFDLPIARERLRELYFSVLAR